MLLHTQRKQLLQTALAMDRKGINQGTSGNVSVRSRNGLLITPSALAYDQCQTGDVVELDLEGHVICGLRKPSSEWRLHLDIYLAHSEAGAVLHAHSPWCTTLACLEREIPSYHYMVAMAGNDSIQCAPYALFGTQELSDNILSALSGGRCACLLAHHGMVCFAPGLTEVLALAIEVENLARVYGQVLQIGEPPLLSDADMGSVLKRFSEYKKEG